MSRPSDARAGRPVSAAMSNRLGHDALGVTVVHELSALREDDEIEVLVERLADRFAQAR